MRTRFVLEIVGGNVGLSTDGTAQSPLWSSSFLPAIKDIPSGTVYSGGFLGRSFDYGGFTLGVSDVSALLQDLDLDSLVIKNVLTATNRTQTTITLDSTSGLPSAPNVVKVGSEYVFYSGISGSQLTGCVRGVRGSYPTAHNPPTLVTSVSPSLVGREVVCYWQDKSTGAKWTRFRGKVDAVSWDKGTYLFQLVSLVRDLQDAQVLRRPFLKGQAYASETPLLFPSENSNTDFHLVTGVFNQSASVASSFLAQAQPRVAFKGDRVRIHQKTEGRTINVTRTVFFKSATEVELAGLSQFPFTISEPIPVSITDLSTTTVYTGFVTGRSGDLLALAGLSSPLPSSGTGSLVMTTAITFEGQKQPFKDTEEISEVRILEGRLVEDILLPLLVSLEGDGRHGVFDILPEGWGLGLPPKTNTLAGAVDVDSFLAFSSRLGVRRYVLDSSFAFFDFAQKALEPSGVSLFVGVDGVLSLKGYEDLYPHLPTKRTVARGDLIDQETPSIDFQKDRLVTQVSMEARLGGVFEERTETIFVEFYEEALTYGRKVYQSEDQGVLSASLVPSSVYALLLAFSRPFGRLKMKLPIVYGEHLEVSDILEVDLPHLPDALGGKGIASRLYIEEISFFDGEGMVEVSCVVRPPRKVGVIAPCGIIESDTDDIYTLKPSSTTLFAPQAAFTYDDPPHHSDGTEDAYWFQEDDEITIFRASTLGDASPETHTTFIKAVNYATREIEPHSTPAWDVTDALVKLAPPTDWTDTAKRTERGAFFVSLFSSGISGLDAWLWGV